MGRKWTYKITSVGGTVSSYTDEVTAVAKGLRVPVSLVAGGVEVLDAAGFARAGAKL